jgi:hypothetical protein
MPSTKCGAARGAAKFETSLNTGLSSASGLVDSDVPIMGMSFTVRAVEFFTR